MSSMEESMSALSLSKSSYNYDGPILRGQHRQYFAFSDKIMYYIAMNPASVKVYKKLVRTCKYFYNLNPIFVVSGMCFGESDDSEEYEWEADGTVFDMNVVPYKFWITKYICIRTWKSPYETVTASFVQKKLFRSDASDVMLNDQTVTLDALLLLASKAKDCNFNYIKITENKGEEVMVEKVIEKLPKLRKLWWQWTDCCKCFSTNTAQELLKIPHFGDITSLGMYSIPSEFDAKAFFDYIKTQQKHMDVSLQYESSNISDKIKKQIDEIIDEMNNTQVFTYKPPMIFYRGRDDDDILTKMNEIQERYEKTKTLL